MFFTSRLLHPILSFRIMALPASPGPKAGLIQRRLASSNNTGATTYALRHPSLNLGSNKHTTALSALNYAMGSIILMFGVSYASSPLYKAFCGMTGFGGTVSIDQDVDLSHMQACKERKIKVSFNADTNVNMKWNFKPQQRFVYAYPGEASLAFYQAENPTNSTIIGISTYNVVPFEAGSYFNKIQCFCFEEQRLNPHEVIDMPVFFYIDPAFLDDPTMQNVNEIYLSYTFFEAKNFDYEKYRKEGLI